MDGVHVVCLLVSMLERVVRVGGRWWSIVVDGEDTEVTVIAAFTRMSFSSILDPGLCRGKTAHGGGYGSRSPPPQLVERLFATRGRARKASRSANE
jgi:hypothetical protein